jgi:hypothetical protein
MLIPKLRVLFLTVVVTFASLFLYQSVWAKTHVQSTAENRIMMFMHVEATPLQKKVPEPWKAISIPGGPLKGANFIVIFIDGFLLQDAQGKPDHGGVGRKVVFVAPVRNSKTGEIASMVLGGFGANPKTIPGSYKNFTLAHITSLSTSSGIDFAPGTGTASWEVKNNGESIMSLKIEYQKALPVRKEIKRKIYSSAEPSFFRIYHIDSATDMIKSVPAGFDRLKNYQFHVNVPAMKDIFDGNEKLVGLSAIPLYVRQVFLP